MTSAAGPAARPALTSVVVRSMGRQGLGAALQSIAVQTHPAVEVVLVNALGYGHPPAASTCGRFPVRLVEEGRPIPRARAANLGVAAAHGEVIAFLDDDDQLYPGHLQALSGALLEHSDREVAYVAVDGVDAAGAVVVRFDRRFSAAALRAGNYIPLNAVAIRRAAFSAGVRFDEELEVYEDWDLFLQLERRAPFVQVDAVGALYRMGGASGIGLSGDDEARRRGRAAIFEKWRGRWSGAELEAMVEALNDEIRAREAEAGRLRADLAAARAHVASLEAATAPPLVRAAMRAQRLLGWRRS